MKNSFLVSALLAVLAISSCQVKEEGEFAPKGKTFTATMEVMVDNESSVGTKTSLDNSNILWKQGDQVSVFAGSTLNERYQVTDESDGKTSASLYQVSTSSGFVAGGEISANVAFYPYISTASIAKSGSVYVISDIALPSAQDYAEDSFGNGAYPMAAVTSSSSDNKLKFKNVLGGLKLQVKGTAAVTSISVTGNNNEKLCGAASVTVSNTAVPTLTLSDATATTVTLDCGDGIQLDAETVTAFIIALPPMTMEGGFTITLNGADGSTKEVSTTKSQTITRSNILKMPAISFDAAPVVAGPKFIKVTSTADVIPDGQYILVYETASKAFKPILASGGTYFTKSEDNAIDIAFDANNNVIAASGTKAVSSSDLDDCLITFEDGKYLWVESAGKYLYPGPSGTSALGAENKTESHTVSISIADNGIATIARSNDATYHLYWSTNGNYFSGIQQTGNNSGEQYDANICLYMLEDGLQSQSMSFSAGEAAYDVYAGAWEDGKGVPGLSGAETTVTYASSNESVATVDPTSGAVTIASGAKKGDKAVITATAEKDATWRAATASYTITITNSDPNVPVYTKVLSNDDIETGARYLLVNESNSKVFKPVLNGTSFTAAAANAVDATIEDHTIVSDEFGDCELSLENGYYFYVESAERYLYPSSNIGAEESKSDSHKFSISIASDGVATVSRTSSGSTYRLRWTSQGYFQSSTSTANSQLYKLDDGLQSQNISFSADGASYDVFAGDWEEGKGVPALDGAQTDVTYSSSNESVATVDASTGAVTIVSGVKKGDKAVITATAEQDGSYRAATASYTISIVDSSVKTPEYVLVESNDDIEAEAKYLLVNESNNKVFKPVLNGSSFTAAAANALDATIDNHTIVSDEFVECELTLETGYYFFVESANRYIYPTSSNIGAEETKGSSHNLSISIASDGVATIARVSGTSYKLRWTSQGYFQSSTSSANCQLYKLQDARQPQYIAFVNDAAEYDVYTSTWTVEVPELDITGVANDVVYESLNEDVATVDSNTGVVTIAAGAKNNDTAVIRAIAVADASYKEATATYTITIVDSAPKNRNLAFSQSEVSVNIYDKTLPYAFTEVPTLSGNTDGGVTYSVSCSDDSIDESAYPIVSADTGEVTINGTGVFTIKASAPATSELQAGEASYTLTVTNDAPPTYTKVSEITSGATYLIVSTDANNYNGLGQKRAFAGTTSGSVVEVDGSSGTITGDFSACEFVITAEGDATYSLKGPNGYVTGNSATDPYIQVSSSKVTVTLTDAATLNAATSTDGLVSDAFYFYYLKNSSKEVLYLTKTTSGAINFKMGGSGRKYGVYLYKKNN